MQCFKSAPSSTCAFLGFLSFQSPSPSFHGLVALAAYGTVTNNLTLVQAALQEASKLAGACACMCGHYIEVRCVGTWLFCSHAESQGAVVGLHLSCVEALKVMLVMFQSTPQVSRVINVISDGRMHQLFHCRLMSVLAYWRTFSR